MVESPQHVRTAVFLSAVSILSSWVLRSLQRSDEDGPELQQLVSKCSLFIARGGLQSRGIFSL